MAKSEGKRVPFEPIENIDSDILEVFPYSLKSVKYTPNSESHCEIIEDLDRERVKQLVKYSTDELSAVCPYSGLPDLATLNVEYIPKRSILELKSFKYYLLSFRNVGIYQEHLTEKIYRDLKNILEPEYIKIETIYNTRGGIDSTCIIKSSKQK